MSSHIIKHTEVFTADKRDSECLLEVAENLIKNLSDNDIREEVIAERRYSSGEAIMALEEEILLLYPKQGTVYLPRENYS